jgi:hypothetical protein
MSPARRSGMANTGSRAPGSMREHAVIPRGLTCNAPILIATKIRFTNGGDTFCLELGFCPGPDTHRETGLTFSCSWFERVGELDLRSEKRPCQDYGATVGSSGRWIEGGGVTFCGMSQGVLYLEWERWAAAELNLPQFTVIELGVDDRTVDELRVVLRSLFDWDTPDKPRLELAPPSGPVVEQLALSFP